MSSLTVPRFLIKNAIDYDNDETEANSLNKESWRYLYDRTNENNVPDPTGTNRQPNKTLINNFLVNFI